MDRESNTTFLGLVVASFGVAQMFASIFFGYLADRTKKIKGGLIYSVLFTIAGSVIYVLAEYVPNNGRYVVLAGRFFVGLGAGEFCLFVVVVVVKLEHIAGVVATVQRLNMKRLNYSFIACCVISLLSESCQIINRHLFLFQLSGDIALGRTYVSTATTVGERTDAVAKLSSCVATGYMIGPCKCCNL